MSTHLTRHGSVPKAMAWMLGLSVALFWMPFLGSLIAGFVGGRKAGGVFPAVMAVILPGIVLVLATAFLGGLIGWIPILGQLVAALAGMGAWVLGFVNFLPMLAGAVIGGWTAK